jgi:hypothetical protein
MRWTPKRKQTVVVAYHSGLVREVAEVLAAHSISLQEFQGWLARFDLLGAEGLRVSR